MIIACICSHLTFLILVSYIIIWLGFSWLELFRLWFNISLRSVHWGSHNSFSWKTLITDGIGYFRSMILYQLWSSVLERLVILICRRTQHRHLDWEIIGNFYFGLRVFLLLFSDIIRFFDSKFINFFIHLCLNFAKLEQEKISFSQIADLKFKIFLFR